MTLGEILGALWRRKWTIVAVTILAMAVAVVFLARLTPNYTSSAVIRISPVMSQAITSGSLEGIAVDADPAVMLTPQVLDAAAQSLGESTGDLQKAVTQAPVPSTSTAANTTLSVQVTATGATPEQAQDRVTAVVTAYHDHLAELTQTTLASLNDRLQQANDQAAAYQAQVTASLAAGPTASVNQIAQSNLTTALSTVNTLTLAIATLQTAGEPLTVSQAASPGASTSPGTLTVLAIALVSGLLAGAGIALIRDHFDDRVRDEDRQIEDLADSVIVGSLANDRGVARRKERMPAASGTRTALSEGIRSLRTSVQVLLPEGRGVVAITSVEPGDGKTFLSVNLAVSWARAGRRVVLVGGDLRRPQFQEYFDRTDDGPGLGGLLSDAVRAGDEVADGRIDEALVSTRYRGLKLLPAGFATESSEATESDEPADLLASASLERIVRHLAAGADIVILDTPPALGLADASELARCADGALMLATVDRTHRKRLVEAADMLRANGSVLFGLVLNRSRRRLPKSYGSYYVTDPGRARPDAESTKQSAPATESAAPAGRRQPTAEAPADDGAGEQNAGEAPASSRT